MSTGPEATFSSFNPIEPQINQPTATITVGAVPVEDAAGMYQNTSSPLNFFSDTILTTRLENDRHVMMMPLCSPTGFQGSSCAFVQLAAPTTLKIVDGTIARLNEPPIVPSPQSLDPSWILLDAHVEAPMLTVGIDGITPLYRVTFCFVYGKANPNVDVCDDLIFPRPPWLKDLFPSGRNMSHTFEDPTLVDIPPFTGTGTLGGTAGAGGSFG